LWAWDDGITWTRCHATTEIMQSDSAPKAVASREVASLDEAKTGKDKDEDEGTGSGTDAISVRCVMNSSGRSISSKGISTGFCAGFWAGEDSIGTVDDTVDGIVGGTIGGGTKSSTTPITGDGLYEGATTPALWRKSSMTSARWRWFSSAMESWRKLRNVQRR
jgi:hypothetical protein